MQDTIPKYRERSWEKRTLLILFCITWLYLGLRAAFVPFSHDETATFFHFVQSGQFIPYTGILWDANNHLLNSFLTYLSFQAFGSSEFALRLPSLLLVPFYFYFHYRIGRRLKHPIPRWSYWLALLCTHYLIEYLGYCRGYGMSLIFLAGSVHFAMSYFEKRELKHFLGSLGFAILALLANLSLLYPILILFAYGFFLLARELPRMSGASRANAFLGSILSFACLGFCIKYLFDLKEEGALYMGGASFIETSLQSLSQAIFYAESSSLIGFQILLAGIGLLTALYSMSQKLDHKIETYLGPDALLALLFFGPLIAMHSAHFLLDVNYPEARGLIYIAPMVIGCICFNADRLKGSGFGKALRFAPILLLLIPLPGLGKINLSYQTHRPFRLQRIPERYVERIIERSKDWKEKATVAGYKMRHFVYGYHNYRNGGRLNPFHTKGYPDPAADFQIVDTSDAPKLKQDYVLIDHDPITDYSLLQRKERSQRKVIRIRDIKESKGLIEKEFFDLYKLDPLPDSLQNRRLIFEMDLDLRSPETPFEGRIVIEANDASGNKTYYDYFSLDWVRYRWAGKRLRIDRYTPPIPPNSQELTLYLWNPHRSPFRIKGGEVGLGEYVIP